MIYDILQVITNNYDTPYPNRDIKARNKLLLSDVPYNMNGWNNIQISSDTIHPFNTIFNIRWHPFNYSDAPYIIWVDGSLEIKTTLEPLIHPFIKSNADIALLVHPSRTNIFNEYIAWMMYRHYPKDLAFKWLHQLESMGVDVYNSGLYQTNIIMYKKTPETINWCNTVWNILHWMDSENAERLDQTIVTALSKKIKVFEMPCEIYTKQFLFNIHYNH